jgi:hypothetical protein
MAQTSTLLKVLGLLVPVVAILLAFTQFGLSPSSIWSSKGQVGDPPSSEKASSNATVSGPKTITLSDDPVVVYIKDFITAEEAVHLVGLT